MVLRAFATHPVHRHSSEALAAADLLKVSFFKPDFYPSYQAERYWVKFRFWWHNLVTALESLLLMGYPADDADVQRGLNWLSANQLPNKFLKLEYGKTTTEKLSVSGEQLWLTLRIARCSKGFIYNTEKDAFLYALLVQRVCGGDCITDFEIIQQTTKQMCLCKNWRI